MKFALAMAVVLAACNYNKPENKTTTASASPQNNFLKIKGLEIDPKDLSIRDEYVIGKEKKSETSTLIRVRTGDVLELNEIKDYKILDFNYTELKSTKVEKHSEGTNITRDYESPEVIESKATEDFLSSIPNHLIETKKDCYHKDMGKKQFICLNNQHLIIKVVNDFVSDCKVPNVWGSCWIAGGVSFGLTTLDCDSPKTKKIIEESCF